MLVKASVDKIPSLYVLSLSGSSNEPILRKFSYRIPEILDPVIITKVNWLVKNLPVIVARAQV